MGKERERKHLTVWLSDFDDIQEKFEMNFVYAKLPYQIFFFVKY